MPTTGQGKEFCFPPFQMHRHRGLSDSSVGLLAMCASSRAWVRSLGSTPACLTGVFTSSRQDESWVRLRVHTRAHCTVHFPRTGGLEPPNNLPIHLWCVRTRKLMCNSILVHVKFFEHKYQMSIDIENGIITVIFRVIDQLFF